MLPDWISGKMKVLAWPATAEPGNFCWPTTGETAASNCISPSMASSGAAALALSQAFFILSTASPLPEPLVE